MAMPRLLATAASSVITSIRMRSTLPCPQKSAARDALEMEPKFYSDISSFIVTLYNLNHNVSVEKESVAPEKVAIGEENMLIEVQKLSIQKAINSLDAKKNIKANAMRLFNQMGIDGIFGRTDIMEVVGISITAAGNLITKLKDAGLIQAVSGYGKGKYKFANPQ